MSGIWQPSREAHAIEIVGAAVTLSEPLNDTLLRKALRAADKASAQSQLVERTSLTGIQVKVHQGVILPTAALPANGISFKRTVMEEGPLGNVVTVAAEELVVDRQSVVFRSRRYERWNQFKHMLFELVPPVLDALLGSTAAQSARLEYRDRFTYSGNSSDAPTEELLRKGSPYIAQHVFDAGQLWHSHTGMFVQSEGVTRRLIQIAIDATDIEPAEEDGVRRSVAIMTGVQDDFRGAGIQAEDDQDRDMIMGRFESLHDCSKEFFRKLITDDVATRIGLGPKDDRK
jgi:uncharacterized protein (TIGR04255 family)